ncbi:hypothetical protein K458DRAFT_391423 [Lentithecium fluviatile CBS 122367]|uniref:Uncharacterized protein n=1 Tax=Lentithecium fluviatile CBS 122367 TaxID=1168545 RepID=A0A6G1IVC6_9PLEO|nr:hypothetical protein K458DRAFT_391423 [Lentithecium fluviatile CBS 122367]
MRRMQVQPLLQHDLSKERLALPQAPLQGPQNLRRISPPGPDNIRIIKFEMDAAGPKFDWVRFIDLGEPTRSINMACGIIPPPCMAGYPGHIDNAITFNEVLDRKMGPLFQFTGLSPGSTPNKSFEKLDPFLARLNTRPMLFWGENDVDATDFRHILDKTPTIEAVRINCMGDIAVRRRPTVEKEVLPRSTCNYDTHIDLPIAIKVGVPLTALSVGTITTVRKDKKHLLVAHVRALVDYCQTLTNEFARQHPTTPWKREEEAQREPVDGFATFYNAWVKKDENKEFAGAPGPYDI